MLNNLNRSEVNVFNCEKSEDYWATVLSIKEKMKRVLAGLPFYDGHLHLYPDKLFKAIFNWFEEAGWDMPYRMNNEVFVNYLKMAGVDKAFLLFYAHKPGVSLSLNTWAQEFCQANKNFLPFASIHPLDENRDEILDTALVKWNFPGVKLHLNVQSIRADMEGLFPVYETISRLGKRLVIHAGTCPYPEEHLKHTYLEKVLQKFPEMKVQIAHLGLNDFEGALNLVSKYPRVFLDTSYILGNPNYDVNEYIDRLIENQDRIIYGSDFPLIEHDIVEGLEDILHLNLGKDFYQKLFSLNAQSFLK